MEPAIKAILDKHPEEWNDFKDGGEIMLGRPLYTDLYEYFVGTGEMPYSIAKARTGDPDRWIEQRMERYIDV